MPMSTKEKKPRLFADLLKPYHETHAPALPFSSELVANKHKIMHIVNHEEGTPTEFRVEVRSGIMEVFPVNAYDHESFSSAVKEGFGELLAFWEGLAESADCLILQLQETPFTKKLSKLRTKKHFQAPAYEHFSETALSQYMHFGFEFKKASSFVRTFGELTLPSAKTIESQLNTILETSRLADPLFTYESFSNKTSKTVYYYYPGHEGGMMLLWKDNELFLKDLHFEFEASLSSLLEQEHPLEQLLTTIEKTRRLDNLFHPPMYYTKKVLRGKSSSLIEQTFHALSQKASPAEVERYFATCEDGKNFYQLQIIGNHYLMKAMGTFFVFSRTWDDDFHVFDTESEAIAKLSQLAREKLKTWN